MNKTALVDFPQIEDYGRYKVLSKRLCNVSSDGKRCRFWLQAANEWDPREVRQLGLVGLWQLLECHFSLFTLHEFFP